MICDLARSLCRALQRRALDQPARDVRVQLRAFRSGEQRLRGLTDPIVRKAKATRTGSDQALVAQRVQRRFEGRSRSMGEILEQRRVELVSHTSGELEQIADLEWETTNARADQRDGVVAEARCGDRVFVPYPASRGVVREQPVVVQPFGQLLNQERAARRLPMDLLGERTSLVGRPVQRLGEQLGVAPMSTGRSSSSCRGTCDARHRERNARAHEMRRLGQARHVRVQELHRIVGFEGRPPDQCMIESGSQLIEIAARIDAAIHPSALLRRCVTWIAAARAPTVTPAARIGAERSRLREPQEMGSGHR